MPPPRWSTDPQFLFLKSQVSEFLNAQKEHLVARFWVTVDRRWFDLWPEDAADDPTGEKVAARKKVSLEKVMYDPNVYLILNAG